MVSSIAFARLVFPKVVVLLALWLSLVLGASDAHAQYNGTWFSVQTSQCSDIHNSYGAFVQCYQAQLEASTCSTQFNNDRNPPARVEGGSLVVGASAVSVNNASVYCQADDGSDNLITSNFDAVLSYAGTPCVDPDATVDPVTFECVSPPECPFQVGEVFVKQGAGPVPTSVCQANCQSSQQGPVVQFQTGWIAQFAVTGSCGADDTTAQDGLNCVSNGVASFCMDPTAQTNCGTVNGQYVCLDTVPQGNCVFLSNGDSVCGQGATTETPDLEVEIDDGQGGTETIGIHTGGVSSDGSGGVVPGTDDTDGDGLPGGPGGSGDGDGSCDGPGCQGDVPSENEAVDDFGTLFSTFWGRVEAAPIVQSFTGIAGSMPVGACDPVSSDPIAFLGNTTLQIDTHCTLWPQLVPIINGVMLAIWALLGGIIIFRA